MTETDADLDAARANVAGADDALDFVRRVHQDAVERAAAVAADPGAQEWEAEAAASSVDIRAQMVRSHERLAAHHRGVLDARASEA